MQSWPLCRHPRKHLPSDAGAGQDDGMDFVISDPGHLAHASKRRFHALISRLFRVVHSEDHHGFE